MSAKNERLTTFLQHLGPGLLYAGAAIGVSHLVQSTRAGAEYGFLMIIVIILIHIFKYPFFQFGPKYAAATGESLLQGYKRLGNTAFAIFIVATIGTIFTIQAAVTVVTAGIAGYIFNIDLPDWQMSGIVLLICMAILAMGKYKALDRTMKLIIILLTISTFTAVFLAFGGESSADAMKAEFHWNKVGIAFLIGLMGWMPAPLDLSVWVSLWNLEKKKQLKDKASFKLALLDFNIGYWGTAILAIGFLMMGALMMYGRGISFEPGSTAFAEQLISLYTHALGSWAYWIVAIAALTTMFSTTLTVLDAIPRVLFHSVKIIFPAASGRENSYYWGFLLMTVAGALVILGIFIKNMVAMVMAATILSFLTTPFIAVMNYLAMRLNIVPADFRPKKGMIYLSWAGIIFLTSFAIIYLISLI